jgi:glyoxylase-like metal-dependent hydrolase (beta-lactamase superfamily II)
MKPALISSLLLAALVTSAGPAGAVQSAPVPQSAEALAPFTARQLAPGVHLLATPPDYLGPVIGNVTLIEQSDGIVLIDSGLTAADGRRVAGFVRSITGKPVKVVVITHWHNDHPQGVSSIRAVWPAARVISTARTREHLAGPAMDDVGFAPNEAYETSLLNQLSQAEAQIQAALRDPAHDEATRGRYACMLVEYRRLAREVRGTHLVLPTETFIDALLLDDPVRPVRLIHLGRANTDGDALAWLPNERIVVTGDVVVSPTPFGFFSFPEDWIGVLERLKAMDHALLVPGHGEPQADTTYLDRLIGTLRDVRAQVGPLARQGLTLEQVRERVDYSAQTDLFGDTPRNRRLFDAFWLTPITESAWREARGEPIVQGGEDGE